MMNGEKKFLLVALSLLGLGVFTVIACVAVTVLGHLNEQMLRRQRLLYHSELPLDAAGRPLYLPDAMRQAHSYAPSSLSVPPQQGDCYYE